jgi:hypothetical protein
VPACSTCRNDYPHLDCGLRILDCGLKAESIRNPQSAIRNHHVFPCFETFSSTPAANRLMASDDPPALTNGSGMPFVGTNDNVTLMLKNACAMIIVVNPTASN